MLVLVRSLASSLIKHSFLTALLGLLGGVVVMEPVVAHAGALRLSEEPASVPRWLVVSTGGGVVGASFLLTSLMTDHETIRSINGWRRSVPGETIRNVGVRLTRIVSVVLLGVIVLGGLFGTRNPRSNVAILVVWGGWWAGYTKIGRAHV